MREIKFRAWFKGEYFADGGYMLEDIRLGRDYFKEMVKDDTGEFEKFTFEMDDAAAVMQYTGLKDKNGTEIYEGDIVKQDPGFGCEWATRTGTVSYDDASFWFSYDIFSHILQTRDCQLTVLGNIYENPELCE